MHARIESNGLPLMQLTGKYGPPFLNSIINNDWKNQLLSSPVLHFHNLGENSLCEKEPTLYVFTVSTLMFSRGN